MQGQKIQKVSNQGLLSLFATMRYKSLLGFIKKRVLDLTRSMGITIGNKRPMGHKAHQSSSSKLPSPALWTGMMIREC